MTHVPEETVKILDLLLADLFDPVKSRLEKMGSDFVTSEMIPDSLKFQKAVLAAFETCERIGNPPTPENIALLTLSKDPDVLQKVQALATQARAQPMIRASAIWFRTWIQNELLDQAAHNIERLSKIEYGDPLEKRNRMLDSLLNVPMEDQQKGFTRLEVIELLEERQGQRVERFSKSQALGSVLHLKELRSIIPVLSDGDVTLMTAPPKAGKTSVCQIVAEINTLNNDSDVLWLLLETSPETIEERFLARDLLVPGKMLRTGRIDLKAVPFAAAHKRYKDRQREQWETKGRMHLHYVAGAKLTEIRGLIRSHKRLADNRNRPLLVIIDYLQRITKNASKNDVEAIALIANTIKDMADNYHCHILLLSQESYAQEGKQKGDSRAHGSNTPIFIAQNHIAIKVLNANTDIYVADSAGRILKNACGEDRMWQRTGRNRRQAVMRFDVLRSNNDETGNAYAAMEGGLFLMQDISQTVLTDIPEMLRREIEGFDLDLKDPVRQLL